VISRQHRNTAPARRVVLLHGDVDGTIVTTATPRIGDSLHVASAERGWSSPPTS
jgi:hypothetical protein